MTVVITCIRKGDRDSSSMVAAEAGAEIYTGEMETNRTGGQAKTMDSREESGVVVEAMGIHPTAHTPKADISVKTYGAISGSVNVENVVTN